jgi:hypothetical protein
MGGGGERKKERGREERGEEERKGGRKERRTSNETQREISFQVPLADTFPLLLDRHFTVSLISITKSMAEVI